VTSARPGSVADVPALAALAAACNPSPWSEAAIRGRIEDPLSFVFVLETPSSEVMGWVLFSVVADESEILDVGVHPRARRRGYGRALVQVVRDEATARGARSVHLEVRASNAAARGLYAGMGFAEIGVRRRYYRPDGEDAVCMRWDAVDGS